MATLQERLEPGLELRFKMFSWPLSEDDNEDRSLIFIGNTMFDSEDGLVLGLFCDFLVVDVGGDGRYFCVNFGGCRIFRSGPGCGISFAFLPIVGSAVKEWKDQIAASSVVRG